MALQRTTVGWVFQSDLSLAQMKSPLDTNRQERWSFGDSEWHGDYLCGTLTPDAIARIYEVDGAFCVNLRFIAEAGDVNARTKLRDAERRLLEQVLPLVHARAVSQADPFE